MKLKSHIFSATAMSCVQKMTVVPWRLRSSTASRSTSPLTGSRPLHGPPRRLGADEAVDAAGRHLQAEVVDGRVLAEGLGDFVEFDGVHERSSCRWQLNRVPLLQSRKREDVGCYVSNRQ